MLTKARYVLAVTNLLASIDFYESKLGFTVTAKFEGWAFLNRDSITLMLGECKDEVPASSIGDHSYFAYIDTSDVDGLFSEFSERGVQFIKRPTDEPWGMREFGVLTPDGHRMMFGQELAGLAMSSKI
jgi:uncharacterized glyoxalase superfamily protein PhnB